MKDANFDDILKRLMDAAGASNPKQLSEVLGVSSQAVYDAIKKKSIPARWYAILSEKFPLDVQWIKTGIAGIYLDPELTQRRENLERVEGSSELENERKERRRITDEYLKISEENRQLWKENAALREKVAALEAERHRWINSQRNQNSGVA